MVHPAPYRLCFTSDEAFDAAVLRHECAQRDRERGMIPLLVGHVVAAAFFCLMLLLTFAQVVPFAITH